MFQYAAGRRLAVRTGSELVLEDSFYLRPRRGVTRREFQLHAFRLSARRTSDTERRQLASYTALPWRVLRRYCPLPGKLAYCREKTLGVLEHKALQVRDNVFLDGYWQSEKYFEDIADVVRSDFQVCEPMSSADKPIYEKMKSADAVSVHVRRGDYVADPETRAMHGACSLDYYHSAMAMLAAKVPRPIFFIFSDDPEWVRHHLSVPWPHEYVMHNSPRAAHADLRLMSQCKHHIIANSTFSWWSAWLNPSPAKIVIMPKQWFGPSATQETHNIAPTEWLRI